MLPYSECIGTLRARLEPRASTCHDPTGQPKLPSGIVAWIP